MNISYLNFTRTLFLGGALISLNFDFANAKEELGAKLIKQAEENDLSSAASKDGTQAIEAKAAKVDEPEKILSADGCV